MKWADEVSAKTARARKKPSKPLRFLLESGLIPIKVKVLDYGCGRGTDVLYLRKLGRRAEGWDPYWPDWDNPGVLRKRYDIVLNFYVLNVLPSYSRRKVLRGIKKVLKKHGKAFIAVRDVTETKPNGIPFDDGILTSRGTFQKFFIPWELERLLRKEFKHVRILKKSKPLLVEVRR